VAGGLGTIYLSRCISTADADVDSADIHGMSLAPPPNPRPRMTTEVTDLFSCKEDE